MDLSLSEILAMVNECRKSAPVDVENLARKLGIDVQRKVLDDPDLSGMIEKNKNGYSITVNARDAETRQRFTIAHEIGHFIYHRDKIGSGIFDNRAYRTNNSGKYSNPAITAREETQANQFAADLLMPWNLIEELQDTPDVNIIAQKLGVSPSAAKIRLGL